MNVEVKRKHIKSGNVGEPQSCAVALAVTDSLKLSKNDRVEVDGTHYISVTRNVNGTRVKTNYVCPRSVARFVNRFDNKDEAVKPRGLKAPAPFAFRLRKAA